MLTHKGTRTLVTPRLTLRRVTCEDAQAMFDNWASDPTVTEFLTWSAHADPTVTTAVIRSWVDAYSQENYYQWVIVPHDVGAPIGTISVVSQSEAAEKAEVGYCIGRTWWHRGIVTEALGAVIDYLFDMVGFNRIEAKHDVRNPHSGGVMKKCGMTYEGTARQNARNNRGLCDTACYAILQSDRNKKM